MLVVTMLFFGALVGGIGAMLAGLNEQRLGLLMAFVLCGGWAVGYSLGRLFGWPMFRNGGDDRSRRSSEAMAPLPRVNERNEMPPAHCPHCGGELPTTTDGFCPACRTPLDEPAGSTAHMISPVPDQPTPTDPAKAEAARSEAVRQWQADLRQLTPRVVITPILVAINFLVFIAMAVAGVNPFDPPLETLIAWGANTGPSTFTGEWWRLLTCAFLHVGIGHLAFNMLCLFGVGMVTERMVGSPGFLLTYLLAAIAGSLVSVAWSPSVVGVGASGAVFGVFGAFFGARARAGDTIPKLALDASRAATGRLLVINLVFGLFVPNIDVAAHVGGLICGFACGLLLGHPLRPEATRGRRVRTLLLAALSVPGVGLGFVAAESRSGATLQAINELNQVGADEERVLNVYNDALLRAEQGRLNDAGFLLILDRDVRAPWDDIRKRFNKLKGSSGLDSRRMQQIGNYFDARAEAFELLRKAIATGDQATGVRSREKMLQADKMVEGIKRGQ